MITHLKASHGAPYPYRMKESTPVALRSIIFDCDGVLMDSEPLHFAAFRNVLAENGHKLTEEEYKERYLALDDKGAFEKYYRDNALPLEEAFFHSLLARKTRVFQDLVTLEGILPFPAVPEFVMAAPKLSVPGKPVRLAIVTLLVSVWAAAFAVLVAFIQTPT